MPCPLEGLTLRRHYYQSLHRFSAIPIKIPKTFFAEIKTFIPKFTWNLRIVRTTLKKNTGKQSSTVVTGGWERGGVLPGHTVSARDDEKAREVWVVWLHNVCHLTIYLKTIKIVNFMLSIFHHNRKKQERTMADAQNTAQRSCRTETPTPYLLSSSPCGWRCCLSRGHTPPWWQHPPTARWRWGYKALTLVGSAKASVTTKSGSNSPSAPICPDVILGASFPGALQANLHPRVCRLRGSARRHVSYSVCVRTSGRPHPPTWHLILSRSLSEWRRSTCSRSWKRQSCTSPSAFCSAVSSSSLCCKAHSSLCWTTETKGTDVTTGLAGGPLPAHGRRFA